MKTHRITVSGRTASKITWTVAGLVFIVILAWLWINAATSVIGIGIALGTSQAWIQAIGYAFPASDVIAILVDLIARFVYDEDGKPIISQETVRLVWILWFVSAALDVSLTFYVFDLYNFEQFATGVGYANQIITEANRRWIPAVLAVATYGLTVMIIHGSRGILKSAIEQGLSSRANSDTQSQTVRGRRPAQPATPPRKQASQPISPAKGTPLFPTQEMPSIPPIFPVRRETKDK